jgi:hypothetical protein
VLVLVRIHVRALARRVAREFNVQLGGDLAAGAALRPQRRRQSRVVGS